MNTFRYRDARQQKLQTALAALIDAPNELSALLQAELDALQTDNWSVSDRTYLAVGADWLWSIRLTLKLLVDDDPALLALGQQATVTAAHAAAIETLPHAPSGPPLDYLDQVRTVLDGDETSFQELLHAAHRRWIVQAPADRLYPFDDVGVLLPVRLETLFDEPASPFNADPTRWQLSLRVIPDEASICRDDQHVSQGEQQALTAFWNAIKLPGAPDPSWLDGDAAGLAWQQFCDQVTPARAAWLVANLETQFDGETVTVLLPADMPAAPQPNRVGGLPPELYVVAITNMVVADAVEHTIGRLPLAADQQIDNRALTLPLPSALADEHTRWWSNWETAKAVGLGGAWLLPEGMTPENIDVLYVVGIGDETPESHFKAQVDAGELAVLRLGVPTNAVHGNAAADLGKASGDWRKIAQVRLRQRVDPAQPFLSGVGSNLQQNLIGSEHELPYFLGADNFDDTQDSRRLVHALWPALWGHWLTDLWQVGDDGYRVGSWMADQLCPEGPLLPLRIGDQPYGLLPVTALAQWQTQPTFNPESQAQAAIERAMARALHELRAQWAATVKTKRSVVGKTTETFMQLLGQDALSRRYIHREFSPAWTQLAPYIAAFGLDQALQQEFLERARVAHGTAINWLGREPQETYLTNGFWWRNELPLVQPTRMIYRDQQGERREALSLARFLELLFTIGEQEPAANLNLERVFERWWVLDEAGEYRLHILPDSLLIRLLVYATQLAAPWRQLQMTRAQKQLAALQADGALEIGKELDQDPWRSVMVDEATGEIRAFTLTIPDERRQQLARALRATLDSAAHRIDPWITGFAWQRLKQQSASPRRAHRLGVYGWVEGPFLGTPGPTDAGRLHTPSYNQTLAALILRDKFLSSRRAGLVNDSGNNPWAMEISSRKARLAEAIADEVRMGFHIYEIVGRHVEHILGDQVGGHEVVKQLRINARYAMRPERKDPNEVCNGIDALLGLLAGDGDFPLTPAQLTALQQLHAALDTYSDLLMADGVMQLVNRQVDRAAETMEAAAGFTRPPSFEFTRTPPSGYQLESMVLAVLPYFPVDEFDPAADPIRLADPAVAAFVDEQVGEGWLWTAYSAVDEQALGSVTLADLGFTPHETLTLSADFLNELARRQLELGDARMVAPRQHALAQQLVAALGSRPAAGRDFSSDPVLQQAADAAIYAELSVRYQTLYTRCTELVAALAGAADEATQAALLRRALIWGVTPISEPADREALFALLLGLPLPESVTPLVTLIETVVQVLQKRLAVAPKPEDLPAAAAISAPLADHEARKKQAAPDGIPTLAQAIASLASPSSKLAILACWTQAELIANSNLTVAQPEPALDETWLTVVAATRANLARVEALQLELATPLATWSNAPADPWQQTLIAENLARRDTPHEKQPGESVLGLRNQRFVAAYGTDATWAGAQVAVGLIDSFSEAIPMPQRTSSAAFGFNAPAARAPQAILLAVPPQPRQRLDQPLLLQIVAETRQLAHARTARSEDLGEFQSLTPTMWLQSSGPIRVYLEPYPLFE